jgi:hypothetical protein
MFNPPFIRSWLDILLEVGVCKDGEVSFLERAFFFDNKLG